MLRRKKEEEEEEEGTTQRGAGGELVGDMGELEASWTAAVSSVSPKK